MPELPPTFGEANDSKNNHITSPHPKNKPKNAKKRLQTKKWAEKFGQFAKRL